MQKSAFQASQEPNLVPLIQYCLVSMQRLPSVWSICSWIYWPYLAFPYSGLLSLHKHLSFTNSCFIVYFDNYFKI